MKDAFRKLRQDALSFWGLSFSLFFLAFSCVFLALFWSKLPPQIPLFYSRPWGEEQLAEKSQILFLPSFAFFVFLSALLPSLRLFPKEAFLVRILLVSSAILTFLFTVALFQIIYLVV